ncbi:MAG: hypothetical protein QG672_1736 [Pseudomonadota bacterium]|nr:hypothetical protein [Pseudomonadota bacterium]
MTKKLKSGTPFVYDENDRVVGIRDPHTGTDTDLVTAATSPGGGIASRRRGTIVSSSSGRPTGLPRDRLIELMSWMRPTHLPILQPQEHIGMTPITSGVLTVSHDPTVGEFSGSSIKLAVSGAGTVSARIPLPAAVEQGVSSRTRRAAGAVHYRVMCSDWSKITRLYISLAQDGGSTNYWLGNLVNAGESQYGMHDAAYSARWNNVWRTLVLQSKHFTKQGAAGAWGKDARYFYGIDGVVISAISTSAVDVWIDRIYSPDWPCAVITPIFDGWYESARAVAMNEYLPRGWGCGGSANTVEFGGIYPTYADLRTMSDYGFDVFCHGHQLSGASAATMGTSVSEPTFAPIIAAQRRAMLGAGLDPIGMRWHQWLGNLGYGAFDVAAHLRTHGIDASRGDTVDGEFGINPANAAALVNSSLFGDGSWVSRRGRFNRAYLASYYNVEQGAAYDAAATDPTKPTLASETDYVCKTGQIITSYDHQILDSPSSVDVSVGFHRARVADWDARVRAGDLMILNPTMVEMLTYWRPDDVYVRWDGEWVYRHDPTRIAF